MKTDNAIKTEVNGMLTKKLFDAFCRDGVQVVIRYSLLLIILCSGMANAQAPAVPVPAPVGAPQNWGGTGVAYNGFATPSISGWASWATLVSTKGPVYSFTSWDITSSKKRPFTAQSSMRTGVATTLRVFGPVTIMVYGDAGAALSAVATGGSSIGAAYSVGVPVIVKLGRTNWDFVFCARRLKTANVGTQDIYEIGFGRAF